MTTPEQLKEEWRLFWGVAPEHSLKSRKGYDIEDFWLNKIQSLLGEIEGRIKAIEYCSECCSPKEFCSKWGDKPSALDTKEVLSIIQEYKGKKI